MPGVDIPKEVKENLLQNNIQIIKNTIYNLETRIKIAKAIKDTQLEQGVPEELARNYKLLVAYEDELKAVQAE